MASSTSKLFQPIKVGDMTLNHRIVHAPMARHKATATHIPLLPIVPEYYSQRASTPGTLLITEATFIAAKAGGYPNAPGIWSDEQIAAWTAVTRAVHAKGCFIYLQIWGLGRSADPSFLTSEDPSFPYVSSSAVQLKGKPQAPRPLTIPEIHEYVQLFGTAASNAIHRAGFDGVEIHAAHGYLVDQFLQDITNKRTDMYGGSAENRTRFVLEIIEAVVRAVGPEKTGIRLSPWSRFNGMAMPDPKPTFSYLVSRIRELYPTFSFIHAVEPRIYGTEDRDPSRIGSHESNDFLREIWAPKPFISAGGYTRMDAIDSADTTGDLIAFGRHFLSNPDLPLRLKKNMPLTRYNRSTFYIYGDPSGKGYIDYPFARELATRL